MRLGPHLHRIGNDLVAAYLVVTDDGVTVVDAGLSRHYRELVRELSAMGLDVTDVRGVVLTHGDTDHIGFAERLRREHGVPVHVHEADAARARGEAMTGFTMGRWRLAPTVGFFAYALRKGGLRTSYLTEVVEVHDEDELALPGSPRVVAMPGHSQGSIAVHVPMADAVFVGDALTTRHVLTGRAGLQPAPFTEDAERAVASLGRLAELDATWLLPGHGAPWRGDLTTVPERVALAGGSAAAT